MSTIFKSIILINNVHVSKVKKMKKKKLRNFYAQILIQKKEPHFEMSNNLEMNFFFHEKNIYFFFYLDIKKDDNL